jgi:alkyl sulfatase BDS1-like metallo-beta-lactamase superfamily hydrolase
MAKMLSKYTVNKQNEDRKYLPLNDKRDMQKRRIADTDSKQIKGGSGHVAWDTSIDRWLLQGKVLDSNHPSRQRKGNINPAAVFVIDRADGTRR